MIITRLNAARVSKISSVELSTSASFYIGEVAARHLRGL
jgi:hypothetical protein